MGFLKKLFGGSGRDEEPKRDGGGHGGDPQGIYFYAQCDRCGTIVRLRADKQYDLLNEDGGYTWHKTIVDNRCFRPMPAVVRLNSAYEVVSEEIDGGRFVTQEDYEAQQAARSAAAHTDKPPDNEQ